MEAVTTLTWAAALTSRIKIGPATLLLPLRHPTLVAKEFSCLDVLSGGRAILTVGVGGDYPREFAGCGIPMGSAAAGRPKRSRSFASSGPASASTTTAGSSSSPTPTCCRLRFSRAACPSGYRAVRMHRCVVRQHWATAGIRTCTPRSERGSHSAHQGDGGRSGPDPAEGLRVRLLHLRQPARRCRHRTPPAPSTR